MDLYERNGNILYILNILKKYSDEEHILRISQIQELILKEYGETIDSRTIRRNIALLKEKFNMDISTYTENRRGYYILKDPDVDFELGEIRTIIDTFSYAPFIEENTSKNIIDKCKNLQNVYENKKLKDYIVYNEKIKTDNKEVIKNIEDISSAIYNKKKILFEYNKYKLTKESKIEIKPNKDIYKVSPLAIVYSIQELYMIGLNEYNKTIRTYRIDRMKDIIVSKKKRTRDVSQEEIQEIINSTTSMYGSKGEKIEVICKIELLDNVIELFGKDIDVKYINEEQFKLTIYKDIEGFKRYILRNIDKIKIMSPLKLKIEIRKILKTYLEEENK